MELKAKTSENFRKQQLRAKNKVPFNSSKPRFIRKMQRGGKLGPKIGPGEYYDPSQQTWSKRTYNILFAEI